MVFYAAENGSLNVDDMEEAYTEDMLNKRIRDGLEAGLFYDKGNGTYGPTAKAKIAAGVLEPIGKLTDTLDTYRAFSDKMRVLSGEAKEKP